MTPTRADAVAERAPGPASERGSFPTRWIALALFVALALRVIYVLQSRASPLFDAPQMDARYHVEWARALLRGEDFQPGPFFRAPGYPWFLAGCMSVFGDGLLAPRLVQACLGALSVGLVARIAWRVLDARAAIVAAFAAATYAMTIYFEGELLLPVLEILLDLVAVERTLAAASTDEGVSRARATLRWIVAGLCWGLAALVRPNVLLFVLPLVAWAAWSAWTRSPLGERARRARTAARTALAFLGGCALAIAPISAYNRIVGGDDVLISSQGGVNFYIGNNARSDGSSAIVPGTRADWWGGYNDALALAERAQGRTLKPSEVSQHFTGLALAWMRENPGDALAHQLWKARLFWTDYELGNNQDEVFFAERYGPVLRFLPVGFGLVAPLALLGLALRARRGWRELPAWGFVPVYAASVIAFFVCARFRIPIAPFLCIYAAGALVWIVDAWRARRRAPLALAVASFALLAFAISRVPASVDTSHAQGWYLLGVAASARGEHAQAVEHFEKARAANPRLAIVHQALGSALVDAGRPDAARVPLQEALAIDPITAFAAFGKLVDVELGAGRLDAARALAQREGELKPDAGNGAYDLGRVAYARAQSLGADAAGARSAREEARAAFERALSLRLEAELAFNAPFAAGRAAFELGDAKRAEELLERAARAGSSAPGPQWIAEALRGLAAALRAQGRASEVRERVTPFLSPPLPADARAALERELGLR